MSAYDSKPKVLIVSAYGHPHVGGVEKVAARIFDEVNARGLYIRWLFCDVPAAPAAPGTIRVPAWNFLEDSLGLPIPVPKPSAYSRLYREVAACDVLHVHDGYYLLCIAGVLFARWLGKKTVMTIHIWDVPYRNPVIQICQKIAFRLAVLPAIARANVRVTINRQFMGKLAVFKKEASYIATGVVAPFCQGPAPASVSELRVRLGLPLDRKIVLFAGRFSHKKGLDVIRDTARDLPEVLFVLCGGGQEDPEQWWLANVHNLGWVDAGKLRELFSCTDLFFLPSRGEGFPLAIQEAMSCGLTCAVYEETWNALNDARHLFVILDDLPTAAKALRQALARTEDRRLRKEIADYAVAHWSLEAMTDSYIEVYRDTFTQPSHAQILKP